MKSRLIIIICILTLVSVDCLGERRRRYTGGRPYTDLLILTTEALYITQDRGGSLTTGLLAWTPRVQLAKNIGLRAELGASFFKTANDNKFFVSTYGLYLFYFPLAWLGAEVGAGFQNWEKLGGARLSYGGNLVFRIGAENPIFLDRFFVGYTKFELPNNNTLILRLGVGFNLY